MKKTTAFFCISAGMLMTSASAMDICVQENGGCKNLRTGTVYVQEGDKLVDPATGKVFTEIPPDHADSGKTQILRGSGNTKPGPPRDPLTGRVIQGDKRVGIPETEIKKGTITIPGRRVTVPSGVAITTQGGVLMMGRSVLIPPSTEEVMTTRTYTRVTTCSGLKNEIAEANKKWSELDSWNRAEVSERIDNLEVRYRDECR